MKNIKYYPKNYVMSDSLKAFFIAITNDEKLQISLYNTAKLSEVADIANKLGFKVQSSEILQAQAGRVLAILDEQLEDIKLLASGLKPQDARNRRVRRARPL